MRQLLSSPWRSATNYRRQSRGVLDGPADHGSVAFEGSPQFAGSGKTEFAKFLSFVTGWALLDKDVITRPLVESMLTALNGYPNDRLFRRMKIGGDSTSGYRLAGQDVLAQLHANGQVLYQNERYDSTYVVDRPHLSEMLAAGQAPVVHLGQIAGIRAVTAFPAHWATVLLWCSRETTAQHAYARGSTDINARLAAWDETFADLKQAAASDFLVSIDTDTISPKEAARMIAL